MTKSAATAQQPKCNRHNQSNKSNCNFSIYNKNYVYLKFKRGAILISHREINFGQPGSKNSPAPLLSLSRTWGLTRGHFWDAVGERNVCLRVLNRITPWLQSWADLSRKTDFHSLLKYFLALAPICSTRYLSKFEFKELFYNTSSHFSLGHQLIIQKKWLLLWADTYPVNC